MKKNIALLAGGFSGEYEISIKSAENIARHINEALYNVFTIYITEKSWFFRTAENQQIEIDKNNFSLHLDGAVVFFDAVFIAIHGTPGEDGKMQGYFDLLQIPYTGCNVITSALTFNKFYCNKIVSELAIVNVAHSIHLRKKQPFDEKNIAQQLQFPVFVKPAEGGSSIGMSKVTEISKLKPAIQKAFKEDNQILIEEFIQGREISCGVFNTQEEILALPLTEIKSGKDFFDYEAKYSPGMAEEITPAPINTIHTKKIQQISKKLYQKLNCKGIVRFDYILKEEDDEIYFLEVNTTPGQSPESIVPKQLKVENISMDTLYNTLIDSCFSSVSQ